MVGNGSWGFSNAYVDSELSASISPTAASHPPTADPNARRHPSTASASCAVHNSGAERIAKIWLFRPSSRSTNQASRAIRREGGKRLPLADGGRVQGPAQLHQQRRGEGLALQPRQQQREQLELAGAAFDVGQNRLHDRAQPHRPAQPRAARR